LFSFGDQMLDSKMWQAKRKTYIGISKMSNIVQKNAEKKNNITAQRFIFPVNTKKCFELQN